MIGKEKKDSSKYQVTKANIDISSTNSKESSLYSAGVGPAGGRQLCCRRLQWRGAWSDVKTVTGSQPGGGGHSLLHPLSLHHQTSPSYYGQHVSQLFLMISCCYCCQYLEPSTSLLTVLTVHHHPTLCGRTRVR